MSEKFEQNSDILRYERQIKMPSIGNDGQKKLKESSVLVIGAGGLGSPAALYLSAAGIGTIGIADGDTVDLSNLNRQFLHSFSDIGKKKTDSARKTLESFSPHTNIVTYDFFLNSKNITDIILQYDVIVDCSDKTFNKFLINDACVLANKPFVHAGILKSGGQILTVIPGISPCLRCIFGDMPDNEESCKQSGIIGVTCGIAGSIQAAEVIKLILGIGTPLTGKLLCFDCFTAEMKIINAGKVSKNCKICGRSPSIKDLHMYDED